MPNRLIKRIQAKLEGATTGEVFDIYDETALHADDIAYVSLNSFGDTIYEAISSISNQSFTYVWNGNITINSPIEIPSGFHIVINGIINVSSEYDSPAIELLDCEHTILDIDTISFPYRTGTISQDETGSCGILISGCQHCKINVRKIINSVVGIKVFNFTNNNGTHYNYVDVNYMYTQYGVYFINDTGWINGNTFHFDWFSGGFSTTGGVYSAIYHVKTANATNSSNSNYFIACTAEIGLAQSKDIELLNLEDARGWTIEFARIEFTAYTSETLPLIVTGMDNIFHAIFSWNNFDISNNAALYVIQDRNPLRSLSTTWENDFTRDTTLTQVYYNGREHEIKFKYFGTIPMSSISGSKKLCTIDSPQPIKRSYGNAILRGNAWNGNFNYLVPYQISSNAITVYFSGLTFDTSVSTYTLVIDTSFKVEQTSVVS